MSKVALIMGSKSDWPLMKKAAQCLDEFGIAYSKDIVSAHRTPHKMFEFAKKAHLNGIEVIIAGAGGAAHLPGMVASCTPLPVVGVPIAITKLDGLDALLSTVQMPKGVPVATVAIDNAYNAGLLAVRILSVISGKQDLQKKIVKFAEKQRSKVEKMSLN